jgi:1-acyl-sn-glycerol-3-phosphate acyltransferase
MVLFTVLYWSFFAISLPFWFVPQAILFVLAYPFDRRRLLVHLYACLWGVSYAWCNPFWRLTVKGRERLPWNGPAVIVANHLSILDILVLYGLFRPFKWVSKASIFRIPFVGWNMRLNDYVAIRRGDRESIKEMMARCRAHLAAGSPILLFPEGTRSPDGVLQEFRVGAFKLAIEAGCPVIPVAVSGTYRGLPKHGFMLRDRMDALVRVLEPIHPADHGNDLQRLLQATHAAIAAVLPVEAQPRER